jgi:hypothetical protein
MVQGITFAEETLSRVLNKLTTSGDETKRMCSGIDELQQRIILKEWFTQSIVYIVSALPDYP